MTTPDGYLVEEYVSSYAHKFEGGAWLDSTADGHDLTGRFCFAHSDGRITKWYTKRSAPKWLMAYLEMIESLNSDVSEDEGRSRFDGR